MPEKDKFFPLNLSLSEQNQPVQANNLESACIFE